MLKPRLYAISLMLPLALINVIRLMYMILESILGLKRLEEKLKIPNLNFFAVRILPRFICRVLFPGLTMLDVPYEMFSKSVDPWFLKSDKLLYKSDVFVDVGAFQGTYTFRASSAVGKEGKVVAIEPYPHSYRILLEKTKKWHLRNVIVVNVACGNQEGITRLWLDPIPFRHSIVRKAGDQYVTVRLRKLDNLLNDLGIERVNVIKIDVEGAELDVLRGAKLTLQNEANIKLIIEMHAFDLQFMRVYDYPQIMSFLRRQGFACFQLSPRHVLAVKK